MKIAIKDIVIKNRIRKKITGIKELANNIRVYDLINPISIYIGTKELKAGIRRVLAVKSLGWEEIDFRYVKKDVEASENLYREELTPEEKVKSVARLANEVREMARERMLAGVKIDPMQNLTEGNLSKKEKASQTSRDAIASEVGWSGMTYEKAKKIVDSGNKEAIDKMNKTSVDAGYKVLKPAKEENKYDTLGLSVKTFDFMEFLSHVLQKSIGNLMEEAILDFHKDWLNEYEKEDDETRLKVYAYRSHMFQRKPIFGSDGGVTDYGRKD